MYRHSFTTRKNSVLFHYWNATKFYIMNWSSIYTPLLDANEETLLPTAFQSLDVIEIGLSCWKLSVLIRSIDWFNGASSWSRGTSERTLPSDSASLETIEDGASSVPEAARLRTLDCLKFVFTQRPICQCRYFVICYITTITCIITTMIKLIQLQRYLLISLVSLKT